MPKPTDYDKTHRRNLAAIGTRIDRIFKKAAEEAAKIGVSIKAALPEDKIFSFDDYPATQKQIERLMKALQESMETTIANGVRSAWTLSNNKNNALVSRIFGDRVGDLSKEQYRRYFSTNGAALDAFLARKERGMNLSDRVWRYADAFKREIELGLDLGIRTRESAAQMTRSLRQYLQHPDKLFRRVRDRHGNLRLSQAAQDFHPGRGVYRSSYKNARRLAATETNIAYRTSDHLRWQQMDFVVGIEIQLSNNHTLNGVPLTDICDTLAGRYPKDFKFTGWHPHCRCHAITILKTDEEMAQDTERILAGEQPEKGSVNTVRDVPKAFKDWVDGHADRIEKGGSLPYFIADNKARVNAILGLNKTVTIGNREWTIRELIGECRAEKTGNGRVYVHPSHGKGELAENLEFAKWRANQFGEEVILLPNPQNVKSADSFNITRGVYEEYKRSTNPTKGAIDNLLRGGAKQADHIILAPSMMSARDLADALNDRVARTKIAEVRIRIGELEAVYTRKQICTPGFKIRPEDFLNESAFRNRGTSLNEQITDAKVAQFFGMAKKTPLEIAKNRHAARTAKQAAAIQKAWNGHRIAEIQKHIADGLLPKGCDHGLAMLPQDAFNNRIKTLQRAAARHTERTAKQEETIRMRWESRRKKMMPDSIDDDLAKALGIRKGAPMTFEEANELRGNPHYKEDKIYRVNCQSCVVANELRRRGWDVEAFGNNGMKNFTPFALSCKTEAAWLDADGNIPQKILVGAKKSYRISPSGRVYMVYEKTVANRNKLIAALEKELTATDGRYHIDIIWKGKNKGHIITAESINGKVKFYDPQTGRIRDIADFIDGIELKRGVNVLRVDNLRPNTEIVRGVVKKSGSTASTPKMTDAQRKWWKDKTEGYGVTGNNKYDRLKELQRQKKEAGEFPTSTELRPYPNLIKGLLKPTGKSRSQLFSHCKSEEELDAITYIWNHPGELHHLKESGFGLVKQNLTDKKTVANLQRKQDRGVVKYQLYEFKYKGKRWLIKTEETKGGYEQFYCITKNEK